METRVRKNKRKNIFDEIFERVFYDDLPRDEEDDSGLPSGNRCSERLVILYTEVVS